MRMINGKIGRMVPVGTYIPSDTEEGSHVRIDDTTVAYVGEEIYLTEKGWKNLRSQRNNDSTQPAIMTVAQACKVAEMPITPDTIEAIFSVGEQVTYYICAPADTTVPGGSDGLNAMLTIQLGDSMDCAGMRDFLTLMFCQIWDTHKVIITTDKDLEDMMAQHE